MLRSITLHNFQSHADTEVEVGPGITAIVGTNNSGKTAILRGLRWVMTNRPAGTGIIRHGQQSATAAVETIRGTAVRERGKGVNRYVVGGEELTAVGQDVPPQVQAAVGLQPINVQSQLDPVFLLLDSPGAIASAVNDAIHLDVAERVADTLSAQLRADAGQRKALEARRDAANARIGRFARLGDYRAALGAAIALAGDYAANIGRCAALRQLIANIGAVNVATGALPTVPAGFADAADEAEELASASAAAAARYTSLGAAFSDAVHAGEALDALPVPQPDAGNGVREIAAELGGARQKMSALFLVVRDARSVERQLGGLPPTKRVLAHAAELSECAELSLIAADRATRIRQWAAALRGIDGLINDARTDAKAADAAYNEALADVGECPACGQPLSIGAKDHLLEHYR